jgi:hypothetical protein
MCLKKPQSKFVNCNEEATYILIPENGTLNIKKTITSCKACRHEDKDIEHQSNNVVFRSVDLPYNFGN